jgi:hypothetical protein
MIRAEGVDLLGGSKFLWIDDCCRGVPKIQWLLIECARRRPHFGIIITVSIDTHYGQLTTQGGEGEAQKYSGTYIISLLRLEEEESRGSKRSFSVPLSPLIGIPAVVNTPPRIVPTLPPL